MTTFDDISLGDLLQHCKVALDLKCSQCGKKAIILTNGVQSDDTPSINSFCERCFVKRDFSDMYTSQVSPSTHSAYNIDTSEDYGDASIYQDELREELKEKDEAEKKDHNPNEALKATKDIFSKTVFMPCLGDEDEVITQYEIDMQRDGIGLCEIASIWEKIHKKIDEIYGKDSKALLEGAAKCMKMKDICKYYDEKHLDSRKDNYQKFLDEYNRVVDQMNKITDRCNFQSREEYIRHYSNNDQWNSLVEQADKILSVIGWRDL